MVSLIDTTVSENTVTHGIGGETYHVLWGTNVYSPVHGIATGGGLAASNAAVSIVNCTLAINSIEGTNGFGGGIHVTNGAVELLNTLVAANSAATGPDAFGVFQSRGHNLFARTDGIVGLLASDLQNVDPLIGPLQDNGGPTFTHALLAGSPAIDAGANTGLLVDQRGQPRAIDNPVIPNADGGDGTDIGALEMDHVLRFTEVKSIGGDIHLRFTTVSDKSYRLEANSEVRSAVWMPLPGVTRGSGGMVRVILPGAASQPASYYRALELTP